MPHFLQLNISTYRFISISSPIRLFTVNYVRYIN